MNKFQLMLNHEKYIKAKFYKSIAFLREFEKWKNYRNEGYSPLKSISLGQNEVFPMSVKRILVAVDGSRKSMSAVNYVGKVMSKKNIQITLFHVLMQRPETYLDLNMAVSWEQNDLLEEWSKKTGKYIEEFLSDAVNRLIKSGFSMESIKVISSKLEIGYTRDISKKASDNYDAIVVGRYGASNLGNHILGSITSKLAENIHNIPLIVVGSDANANKILIAFDGSANSKRAVENVGNFADKEDCHILLLTIIRPLNTQIFRHEHIFKQGYEKDWIDTGTGKTAPVLLEMRKQLISRGFNADRISEIILREKRSRSESILSEARNQGFGTIVAGRKGLSDISEFIMGRVTRKILYMGSDNTIWIV
jgi:nucleotide-binding universal stress UspA family protein